MGRFGLVVYRHRVPSQARGRSASGSSTDSAHFGRNGTNQERTTAALTTVVLRLELKSCEGSSPSYNKPGSISPGAGEWLARTVRQAAAVLYRLREDYGHADDADRRRIRIRRVVTAPSLHIAVHHNIALPHQ